MTKEVFIKDVMAKPATIAKSAKITEALDKMLAEGADPLIAVNNNTVVGTVSRKAIAEKLGRKQNSDKVPAAIHVANVVEEDFTTVYPDENVNILVPLLQRYKLVVVYDADHKLIGQVSAGDLLRKYQPGNGIAGALEKAVTIEADERVVHLRRRMLDDKINRFVVSDHDKYVGMVTETDVANALRRFREAVESNHQDHQIRILLVRDIMSSPLVTVERTASVADVVSLMLRKNIGGVPVMENGKLAGMVTRSSLVNAL